jgi:hypothetical protein
MYHDSSNFHNPELQTPDPGSRQTWHSRSSVLDPDLAAVLLAFALAGALALPGLRRLVRRSERFCVACGRRILLGERTCDCDR